MKGKSTFTQSESNQIILLIRKKLLANSAEQKKMRDRLRALGFYASDFGIGGGYTENDFLKVVKIIGGAPIIKSSITKPVKPQPEKLQVKSSGARAKSDEAYVLDLCDEVLKLKGQRQYRFDFLTGDSGTRLPVDIYYPGLKLVIEYRERQHTEPVKFFDRRLTVSGISRGEQRKKYDALRRKLLPKNGLKLIELGYDDFEHQSSKKLVRNKKVDLEVIKNKVKMDL